MWGKRTTTFQHATTFRKLSLSLVSYCWRVTCLSFTPIGHHYVYTLVWLCCDYHLWILRTPAIFVEKLSKGDAVGRGLCRKVWCQCKFNAPFNFQLPWLVNCDFGFQIASSPNTQLTLDSWLASVAELYDRLQCPGDGAWTAHMQSTALRRAVFPTMPVFIAGADSFRFFVAISINTITVTLGDQRPPKGQYGYISDDLAITTLTDWQYFKYPGTHIDSENWGDPRAKTRLRVFVCLTDGLNNSFARVAGGISSALNDIAEKNKRLCLAVCWLLYYYLLLRFQLLHRNVNVTATSSKCLPTPSFVLVFWDG